MKYTNITSPVWVNPENTMIRCQVKFLRFADYIPFTASADDIEEHGRNIFADCVSGKWGEIAACPPAQMKTPADYRAINAGQFKIYRAAAADTLLMLQCIDSPTPTQQADIASVREYLAVLAVTDIAVEKPAWPVLPECVII